jgi:hypothetical protein
MRKTSIVVVLAAVIVGSSSRALPAAGSRSSGVILAIDARHPGHVFASGAVGLSMEAWELKGHFSSQHYRVVRLMRLLGPSILRIGGNSVDLSWWTSSGEPPPSWATSTVTPGDLRALQRLLAVTGWRTLLGVNLGHFEPARVADEASYARKIFGARLVGIEIGNEPDDFGKKPKLRPSTYSVGEYVREADAYRQALSTTAPTVGLYGPALGKTEWLGQMSSAAGIFAGLTQHYYPMNTCAGIGSDAAAREPTAAELLSPDVRQQEDAILEELARAGGVSGRPTRIGETNTAACGGSRYASPTFASALWALDWALRSASSGADGINFHGGLGVCGLDGEAPICASSEAAARAGVVTARPEYYGLLAACQLEGGRFVPTRLVGSPSLPNITTWATLAGNGAIKIAIDNMATTGQAQSLSIPIRRYMTGSEELLSAPAIGARSGMALGGAQVTGEGQWRPRWRSLRQASGAVRIAVSPASAAIVVLRPGDVYRRGLRR